MNNSQIQVPIRPLHVEIEGVARYRQAHTVDDLARLLLSTSWPSMGKRSSEFHQALATVLDAMELYRDPEDARAAFVHAAHAADMHVLPDDMAEMKMAS
ncbi:DUF982 domain-containing protein [Rhizobium sp. NZLR5]|jgi:hypothetical protein|uniref:DUF982 domain-containing protein n=1 Tax=unclassified Rhizobium TaxID=2613769 RepID=UPI001C83FF21|nr:MULTISPECIES: DUF982 domain-containing protein [unclassified Rhizobium]MBX5183435.1 DUF982 domain-containing protein [Rhizobium sp. NZLR5]MBX5198281.1 DUF982 domain-containing protein [Rhizobium sp. NZLR10]